jgi:hypothetical protein
MLCMWLLRYKILTGFLAPRMQENAS